MSDNPVGRPSVMNQETLLKLNEAFALGCSDEEACYVAGIGKTALYKYQQDHPEFTEHKAALKERPVYLARQSVINGFEKNAELALKYLERKKKDEFSLRTDITTNGKDLPAPILGGISAVHTNDSAPQTPEAE